MWMSMLCEDEVPQLHATGQPHTFVLKKQYFSSKFYNKSLIGSQKRFLTCATWLFVAGDDGHAWLVFLPDFPDLPGLRVVIFDC